MVNDDSPMIGQTKIREIREQIQEDILSIMDVDGLDIQGALTTELCQIVVDNFKKLEN
jgi:hypothetical protein